MSRPAAIAVVAAIAVIAGRPSRAAGSPLELFGFGGRSPAMAGTGAGDSDSFDSAYLNPAGLAGVSARRVSVGYLVGDYALELDGDETDTARPSALVFGAALPLPLGGALRDRVGIGLGFITPTAALVRVRVPFPGDPTYSLLETRSQTLGILVAGGVRVTDRLRLGGGILALAALRGYIFVDADGAGRFSSDSEQRLVTHFAPVAGATYDLDWRDARAGLTFRGASRSEYHIDVTNELADDLPLTLPTLQIAGVAHYDPLTVDAEVGARLADGLRGYALLSYQRWSAYPLPTENPVLSAPPQESPGFHDTVRPHLGVEHERRALGGDLSVRGGYAFLWSPAPEMTGRQSLLDNHRHMFSVGAGLAWPDAVVPMHVDVWTQVHVLQPRKHRKDPDAFAEDDPLPFDRVSTKGHILVGGVMAGVDL
ncbi:MAG TPA: hypothetical protein VMZ28_05240 [Kofleriaceae bacterium]|nr:hypothetical protein [Kofleriaceae bacterium]